MREVGLLELLCGRPEMEAVLLGSLRPSRQGRSPVREAGKAREKNRLHASKEGERESCRGIIKSDPGAHLLRMSLSRTVRIKLRNGEKLHGASR